MKGIHKLEEKLQGNWSYKKRKVNYMRWKKQNCMSRKTETARVKMIKQI